MVVPLRPPSCAAPYRSHPYTFSLRDPDAETPPQPGGLLSTARDWALMYWRGPWINSGSVLLSALLVDKGPGRDPGIWDDIATTELVSPRGDFRDSALMGERGDTNLAHAGPGTYGLRLHARGRDADFDGVQDEDEPITERYLLQVWPSR